MRKVVNSVHGCSPAASKVVNFVQISVYGQSSVGTRASDGSFMFMKSISKLSDEL